jgi:hypothetical protein
MEDQGLQAYTFAVAAEGRHRGQSKGRIASSRRANVITLHADRPVETATMTVDGQPPRTASPSYPQPAGARAWPCELRFYDPSPNGFTVALQLRGSGGPQLYVSDYTVGLEQLPGLLRDRPALDRPLYHSSASLSLAAPSAPDRPCSA